MKTKTLQINKEKCVQALFVLTIVAIFTYIYLVNAVAFNVASRVQTVKQTAVLRSEINQLEGKMISLNQEFDRELAQQFGLTENVTNKTLVVVRNQNSRLTLND
jgi:hypothetical protein